MSVLAKIRYYLGQVADLARLQIYRAAAASIPTLEEGEMALATDTYRVVVGTAGGNVTLTTGGGIGVTDGDKGDIVVATSGTVWTIDAGAVSNSKFRSSAGLSVIGRAADSAGAVADITPTANAGCAVLVYDDSNNELRWLQDDEADRVLVFSGDTVALSKIGYNHIEMSGNRLLGRDGGSTGAAQELSITGGLEFTGAGAVRTTAFTGDVTKTAGGTALTLADGTVSFAKLASGLVDTDSTLAADSDSKLPSQKAVKTYVDNSLSGLKWKQSVRVATTTAGTLASSFENGDTVDGVTLATGDRILIKDQASGAENGIYTVAASGAPSRATDADSSAEMLQAAVFVEQGTTNADTGWVCTNNSITLGSTALTFAQFTGGGSYSAGTGLQLSGTQFSIDSTVATLTGSQTLTNKTLSGASNTITNLGTSALSDDAVTYAKMQNVSATDKVLGRSSSGSGDVEEIACTAAGRALIDDADAAAQRTTLGLGTLATQSGTFSGTSSGTNTGDQTISLTGDVTGSGTGSFAATIANDAVTYAKMQNVSATSRILGRKTASAGDTEECTLSEVLDFVGSAAQGDILYRGASAWARLGAGTSGYYLQTQGAGANPQWAAVTTPPSAATQAEQETATSTSVYVAPGRQQYHPSACKAWVVFNGTGTLSILASYNVESVTDNGTADYTINLDVDFSGSSYCAVITGDKAVNTNNNPAGANITTEAAGSLRILMATSAENPDCARVYAAFYGDQ